MAAIDIPEGQTPVNVRIIDNGGRITGPMSFFMDPPLLDDLQSREKMFAPAFIFLVEHEASGKKIVFDLGIRKNPEEYPPAVLAYHQAFELIPGQEVFEVLQSGGVDLNTIEAVIWSHHHMDHTGNPSGFPSTTDLIVGPGFKETLFPTYPEKEGAIIGQRDLEGRNLRQLDFAKESDGLTIGGYRAIDYFRDGSFYLLESPGHSIDHIMGLARTSTSPAKFILMGGDIGNHVSQWRPSEYLPLPKELSPSPFGPDFKFNLRRNVCPGELFATHVHPKGSDNSPFTRIRAGHPYDVEQAQHSLEMMIPFDGDEDIMVIAAHDYTLFPVLEYFPKRSNDWHQLGWKEKGRWTFLEGFVGNVEKGLGM